MHVSNHLITNIIVGVLLGVSYVSDIRIRIAQLIGAQIIIVAGMSLAQRGYA